MARLSSIGELESYRHTLLRQEEKGKTRVYVCMTGCRAYGAVEVQAALKEEVRRQGLAGQVEIRPTGCHGFCAKAPVIAIDPMGVQYQEVVPEDAAEIVGRSSRETRSSIAWLTRMLRPETPSPFGKRSPFTGGRSRGSLPIAERSIPQESNITFSPVDTRPLPKR